MKLHKYWVYFLSTLKMNMAYKANFFMSLAIDAIFFFISFALWRTIFTEGGITAINDYSLKDTITYYLVTSIIFRFDPSESIYLNWTIWSGYFTNDLIKPWNVPVLAIIDALAEKFFVVLLYIPVLFVLILSARDYILTPDPIGICLFLITLLLGFFMNIAFNLIFHSLTFRFGDQDGNIELFNYIAIFLAGAVIPLSFLPEKIQAITDILPFKSIFFTPIQVFLGKMTLPEIFQSWLVTIIWTAVFYLIFKINYKKGLKYYTGTGR